MIWEKNETANRCEVPVKKVIGSKFEKSNRDRRVALPTKTKTKTKPKCKRSSAKGWRLCWTHQGQGLQRGAAVQPPTRRDGGEIFFAWVQTHVTTPQATFLFITRAWSERIKEFLTSYKLKRNGHDIDFIFISSAIWDLSRLIITTPAPLS